MLFAFLIIAAVIACFFLVVGIAIGNQGREQLRLEIASLRERLAASEGKYQESQRITGELLEVVKRQVGVTVPVAPTADPDSVIRSRPDYIAPTAKNCPKCSVSVREDTWPQQCPNCQTWFGDDWPDEIDLPS